MKEKTPVKAWTVPMSSDKAQIQEEERVAFAAERNQSFLFLLTDWAENTSWGGVPYVVKKKNYFFKLLWLALVLGGLGVTTYQTWEVFDKYWKYPVNVNVNMTYSSKLQFPAVTLCNVNIMRISSIPHIPLVYYPLFTAFFGNGTSSVTNAERQKNKELFEQVYNSMDYITRMNISHQRKDMVIDCTFNGQTCSESSFVDWNDAQYGNCFTFNTGWMIHNSTYWYQASPLETYRTGPNYGLNMELYIEEEEYLMETTDISGFKIIIHHQGSPPFPGDRGIYLAPATYNSITIQKINITRQPAPYPSGCVTMSLREDAMKIDGYVEYYQMHYDIGSCFKSCYQSYVIEECQCGDPKIPINTLATRSRASNQSQVFGPCNTLDLLACQNNVSQRFAENLLNCDQCRVACEDIVYTHSLSTAKWPNEKFKQIKLDQVAASHPAFATYMANSTDPEENILKLNIHFEELNYEVIYESPALSFNNIYSDIGGVIGLWIGLSFIAVFELIQLAMDAMVLGVVKLSQAAQSKSKVNNRV